jgi:hypothetical protein
MIFRFLLLQDLIFNRKFIIHLQIRDYINTENIQHAYHINCINMFTK